MSEKIRVNVMLPRDLKVRASARAKQERRSLSNFVTVTLEERLRRKLKEAA
jgi:predicted HicB family RNase H-like nuclease